MNKNIDHLNPANWFPFYESASDRRAVPVTFFSGPGATGAEEAVQSYLYIAEREALDPWIMVSGYDNLVVMTAWGSVVIEFGFSGERTAFSDHLVYIPEADFRRWGDRAKASLKEAFDGLWKAVEVGALTKVEFDERANFLRDMRGHYDWLLDDHSAEANPARVIEQLARAENRQVNQAEFDAAADALGREEAR